MGWRWIGRDIQRASMMPLNVPPSKPGEVYGSAAMSSLGYIRPAFMQGELRPVARITRTRTPNCPQIAIYRHIPRMRAWISTLGPLPGARSAVLAGTRGQAVRSNKPSSFSGMKRVLDAYIETS
jgi:hypothetical protein